MTDFSYPYTLMRICLSLRQFRRQNAWFRPDRHVVDEILPRISAISRWEIDTCRHDKQI